MAEVIGVLGVMASAAQLIHYGGAVIIELRQFYERVHGAPERYAHQANQVEQLIETTELIRETESLNTDLVAKHLKTILTNILNLESILQKALNETSSRSKKRYWKALWAAQREEKISRGFVVLEENKSALVLCIVTTYGGAMTPFRRNHSTLAEDMEDANGLDGRNHPRAPRKLSRKPGRPTLSSSSNTVDRRSDTLNDNDSDSSSVTAFDDQDSSNASKSALGRRNRPTSCLPETTPNVQSQYTPSCSLHPPTISASAERHLPAHDDPKREAQNPSQDFPGYSSELRVHNHNKRPEIAPFNITGDYYGQVVGYDNSKQAMGDFGTPTGLSSSKGPKNYYEGFVSRDSSKLAIGKFGPESIKAFFKE
ncbi:hypothetical protein K432DRAFT_472503 [Lepidopterella palustris CBS 459.81]|uniref:Uncharacterized protein n=1 Tax=Lepidopterella palustris CBS 459.81 TaxID=1314670 RepID=A0A8E2JH05_9PEZI|nr:hypothetical protein K432DRAFT_472503 [Lepidopterella palustris CBS 459.81]